MTTKPYAIMVLAGLCCMFACNEKGEPPPQFNAVLGGGSSRLMPVRLAQRDKALIAPAANAESAGAAGAGATASAGGVPIDASRPEAAMQSMVAVMQAGNFAQLPELLVPEQRDTVQQMVDLIQPVIEAEADLKRVLDEKFPGHAIQLSSPQGQGPSLPRELHIVNVDTVDEDNATATVEVPGPTGAQTETVNLRRVEGNWRIDWPELANVPPAEQMEQVTQMMTTLANAMRDVARRVSDDEITEPEAVERELGQAVMGAIMGGMQSGTFEVQPADGNTPQPTNVRVNEAPQQPANAQPQREREQVDEVYSGPGMLRAR